MSSRRRDVQRVTSASAARRSPHSAPISRRDKDTKIIDATGHHVIPGVLDVHVHLELPFMGAVSADDYRTGTRAGARGGVTTVIDFAIPYAGDSLSEAADNWMKKAKGKALIDYTFHICITRWNEHKDQIKGMVDRGFTTFKEFMIYESEGWQSDDRALFGTLEKMKEYGTMLLVHAESARVLDELIARHHTPELMKQYGARLHRDDAAELHRGGSDPARGAVVRGDRRPALHRAHVDGAKARTSSARRRRAACRCWLRRACSTSCSTTRCSSARTATSSRAARSSRSRRTSSGSGRG